MTSRPWLFVASPGEANEAKEATEAIRRTLARSETSTEASTEAGPGSAAELNPCNLRKLIIVICNSYARVYNVLFF
jgi:hypothetical protein